MWCVCVCVCLCVCVCVHQPCGVALLSGNELDSPCTVLTAADELVEVDILSLEALLSRLLQPVCVSRPGGNDVCKAS